MSSSEVTASDADGDPPVKGSSSETEPHVCTHPLPSCVRDELVAVLPRCQVLIAD